MRALRRFVYDLDIPLVNGRVPFHKTAFELVKRCSQAGLPEGKRPPLASTSAYRTACSKEGRRTHAPVTRMSHVAHPLRFSPASLSNALCYLHPRHFSKHH